MAPTNLIAESLGIKVSASNVIMYFMSFKVPI